MNKLQKEKEGSLSHLENAFVTINDVLIKLPSSSVENMPTVGGQLITAAAPEVDVVRQLTGQQLIKSVQEQEAQLTSEAADLAMPSLEILTGAKPKSTVAPPGFVTSAPFPMEAEVKYQMVTKEVEALRAKVLDLEDQLRKSNAVQETNNKTIQAIWSKLEQIQTVSNGHQQNGGDSKAVAGSAAAAAVKFVKIVTADGSDVDVVEFPADAEGGNLNLKSVEIVYPGIKALKYKLTPKSTRMVMLSADNVFVAPEDGWGDRLYYATIQRPLTPPALQQPTQMASLGAVSSVPALAANGAALPTSVQPAAAAVTAPGMLPGELHTSLHSACVCNF